MNQKSKSISIYDDNNNLIDYTEFVNNKELKCSYKVVGNTLFKKYFNDYKAESPPYTEMVSSIIQYDENIMLFQDPTRMDETSLKAIPSGQTFTSFSPPKILSNIVTYEDNEIESTSIETLTIKSSLIDKWIEKI